MNAIVQTQSKQYYSNHSSTKVTTKAVVLYLFGKIKSEMCKKKNQFTLVHKSQMFKNVQKCTRINFARSIEME